MYSYIRGELAEINSDHIVLDVNGIGYQIYIPTNTLNYLPSIGEMVKIHTYLYIREDAMMLYGFLTRDDLDMFKMLITVSGIGPKGGLGILSTLSTDDLRFAVLSDDAKAIAKAPGIGAKLICLYIFPANHLLKHFLSLFQLFLILLMEPII